MRVQSANAARCRPKSMFTALALGLGIPEMTGATSTKGRKVLSSLMPAWVSSVQLRLMSIGRKKRKAP